MPRPYPPIDDDTPIEVELSTNSRGKVNLGIRINGTDWCALSKDLKLTKPGSSQSWKKTIGELKGESPQL